MEILINPNVSYVLLVLGFLIAVLALLSPGTGILEISALFVLVLSAYGIANLPVQGWALALLIIGIIPFVVALRQRKGSRIILLVMSVLAFLVGSTFLFQGKGWIPAVSPVLVLILSPLTIGFTWFMATKSLEAITARPSFDLNQLIGMTGQASSDIRGQGTVYVNGEEWSALSKTFIPAGSSIRVIRRSGLALEVEALKQ